MALFRGLGSRQILSFGFSMTTREFTHLVGSSTLRMTFIFSISSSVFFTLSRSAAGIGGTTVGGMDLSTLI